MAGGEACAPLKKHCRASVSDIKERIFCALRLVQNETGCSTRTLNVFLQRMHIFFKGCTDVKKWEMPRVRARKKSPLKRCLHGCVGCDNYVYGPDSVENECPKCGDARYSLERKTQRGCTHFFLLYIFFIIYIYICIYNIYIVLVAGVLVLSDERTIQEADANR